MFSVLDKNGFWFWLSIGFFCTGFMTYAAASKQGVIELQPLHWASIELASISNCNCNWSSSHLPEPLPLPTSSPSPLLTPYIDNMSPIPLRGLSFTFSQVRKELEKLNQ